MVEGGTLSVDWAFTRGIITKLRAADQAKYIGVKPEGPFKLASYKY